MIISLLKSVLHTNILPQSFVYLNWPTVCIILCSLNDTLQDNYISQTSHLIISGVFMVDKQARHGLSSAPLPRI